MLRRASRRNTDNVLYGLPTVTFLVALDVTVGEDIDSEEPAVDEDPVVEPEAEVPACTTAPGPEYTSSCRQDASEHAIAFIPADLAQFVHTEVVQRSTASVMAVA